MIGKRGLILAVSLVLMGAPMVVGASDVYDVDPAASTVRIHVGKGGMLKFAGHEHDINATKFSGQITIDTEAIGNSSLSLTFVSAGLQVDAAKEPSGDVEKVQAAMAGEGCLDVASYPTIEFQSTKVTGTPASKGVWDLNLTGDLTLHGATKALTFPVRVKIGKGTVRATGKLEFKQSQFGITPITAAGGAVKVKDELSMRFTIVAKARPLPDPEPDPAVEPAPSPATSESAP